VLIQYLMTLAVGDGFLPNQVMEEIRQTWCYSQIQGEDWAQVMEFLVSGGESLSSYEEYARIEADEEGVFRVTRPKHAMRHRLSIGTIVGDPVLKVKYLRGGYLGSVEESFISLIKPGDVFWFGGRPLEFIQVKEMTVLVRRTKAKKGAVPRWMGGRMPLTSLLAELIKGKLDDAHQGLLEDIELQTIAPLLLRQQSLSTIPSRNALLIEKLKTREGYHVFFYPFEGRQVHEVMAAVLAYRLGQNKEMTFSLAMNDYGFELLSDVPIDIEDALGDGLLSHQNLEEDILLTLNQSDMGKRKFRDIASIAGLIFRGFPGKGIGFKHLQASSSQLYDVFQDYEPHHVLLRQAREEVLYQQVDLDRLMKAFEMLHALPLDIQYTSKPGPLAFPIMVDRLRERLSTESIENRVLKLTSEFE
jgi:ATP-dependent Lhr-like helicase